MAAVLESHARLQERFDYIVVEGAGSPAEINLREGDIANMGFAEAVDCPVIIIADIDKGGVFAHLVGTLELLSKSERQRTVGFIINRFRGDTALLQSGLDWLEEKTGKPVLGVIPYLKEFYLDAEDAIDTQQRVGSKKEKLLKIVVPVYPRISNHTDFDALRLHPDVDLQFIAPGKAPPPCDLVILPGTKNVRGDLAWLKSKGWERYIERHLRYGGKLIAICGGYQILGQVVADPLGIEGEPGESSGLGYIPMRTELREAKVTQNKKGLLSMGGDSLAVEGYEIHCGISEFFSGEENLITYYKEASGKELEGYLSADEQIIGTYLHGLFDNKHVCQALLKWAYKDEIQGQLGSFDLNEHREQELERLASTFAEHIDWHKFWRAAGSTN